MLLELCLSRGSGGLELYAEKVTRYFVNKGIPCIPVISKNSFLDKRMHDTKIKPQYLKVTNQYFPFFAAIKLAIICRSENITTMHIHWRNDFPLAVFAKIFSCMPIRLVYTRQMALTRDKRDIYHKFLYNHLNYYLTITEKLRKEAVRYLPLKPELIRVLYYGVPKIRQNEVNICHEYFNEIGLDSKKFTVGLFGRIEYAKGQHVLINATLKLLQQGVKIQSAIIGNIMDQTYFEEINKLVNNSGYGNEIRFAGFHSNPTSIMGCFDVVVLTTAAETFGLVLPEAMRAGTAVIGTNAGGVPEIIQDGKTGLLFEPGNVDHLSACLKKYIDNPELHKRLALNGKVFADENFSEEKHFEQLESYLGIE